MKKRTSEYELIKISNFMVNFEQKLMKNVFF